MIVARFCHFYPSQFRDGLISWHLFWLLYQEWPMIYAMQRVNLTQGSLYAGALINGAKTVMKNTESDLREAKL